MQAWERFWYSEGPTLALGVFRVLFAVAMGVEVSTSFEVQRTAIVGGFHHPYVGFITPVSERAYALLHWLQYPACILLAVGLWPRTACAALLGLEGYLFLTDHLHFRNHVYLELLITGLLIVSPCDRSLAVGPLRAGARRPPVAPVTAQRLIQVQVCLMYFWAGINKFTASFLSGDVLASFLGGAQLGRGLSGAILDLALSPEARERVVAFTSDPSHMQPLAWGTVALELSLPFALWWRPARPLAILAGLVFHVAIGISMDILTFSLVCTASYLLFLEPETLARLLPRRSSAWPTRRSSPTSATASSR